MYIATVDIVSICFINIKMKTESIKLIQNMN